MESSIDHQFPRYRDGDVEIMIAPLKTYQLHSNLLRRSSNYFAEVLNDEEGAKLSTRAIREGVRIRYRLQLVKAEAGAIGSFRRLVCT